MSPRIKKILITFVIVGVFVMLFLAVRPGLKQDQTFLSDVSQTREFTIAFFAKKGPDFQPVIEGFKDGIANSITNKDNVVINYRLVEVEGDGQEAYDLAASELVQTKPDLIVPIAVYAITAVQNATRDTKIPIVYIAGGDPVVRGYVDSMKESKNNMTGVTWRTWELSGKRLELLKRIKPSMKNILVLTKKNSLALASTIGLITESANSIEVKLLIKEVDSRETLIQVLHQINPKNIDALYYVTDPFFADNANLLIAASIENKLPLILHDNRHMKAGALASYGADYFAAGSQASRLAKKILVTGILPTQIPSEGVTKLLFSLNNNTANEIGIVLPEDLVLTADELISVNMPLK